MQSKEIAVVMYHYVRDYLAGDHRNMKGVDCREFENQINAMRQNGGIIDYDKFIDYLNGSIACPDGKFLLTFDDGFTDCLTYIAPILDRYECRGIFHIITKTASGGYVPLTHKMHYLLGNRPPSQLSDIFWSAFYKLTGEDLWSWYSQDGAINAYRWDTDEIKKLKWTINFGIPYASRELVINSAFEEIYDEVSVCDELFMGWDDIQKLGKKGHIIGGHSHSHLNLGALSTEEQKCEIFKCAQELQAHGIGRMRTFSYPFGKKNNYTDKTIELVQESGYELGFSNIVGVQNIDNMSNRYEIMRIDPKDLPQLGIQ